MGKKEIHEMTEKFKKGNLYLYNHFYNYVGNRRSVNLINIPVLSICQNKICSTWVCLLPDGKTAGLLPEDLTDITIKRNA
tara:strand:+ start:340 stop:579 length:240 start_codon:yes stop_codon:yes gene_type:complete